jgi:hypothetical protein
VKRQQMKYRSHTKTLHAPYSNYYGSHLKSAIPELDFSTFTNSFVCSRLFFKQSHHSTNTMQTAVVVLLSIAAVILLIGIGSLINIAVNKRQPSIPN